MKFKSHDFETFLSDNGTLALISDDEAIISLLNQKTNGQITRAEALRKEGENWIELNAPNGLNADRLLIGKPQENMRELGGELVNKLDKSCSIFTDNLDFVFGFALRNYRFDHYQKKPKDVIEVSFVSPNADKLEKEFAPFQARIAGVHTTRDLVNEPANILTTTEFAKRVKALEKLGVEVEILDETELGKIGMRALLGVGQGSESPSKVAIMVWNAQKTAPIALVGKGVVFDTGGISIKPAAGMEDMIMDMGGAASVVGTMKSLAMRKSSAYVVGIIGLVENMPDGKAQRPGDIVKTLKGDTVEVINTDAEGRLVLADILWYVQERYSPSHVIDLATLTGAIIIALGSENAGIFGNDQEFVDQLLNAAKAQNEGAWQMPLGENYNKMLKSLHADIGNIGGREAGSITAAQFLQRFVQDNTKWIHIDIAGVATQKSGNAKGPKGATGWGVLTLDQLISDQFEH